MSEEAKEIAPIIACRLVRFNPRRMMRGAPAAEVLIESEEFSVCLWMTLREVEKNIVEFGRLPGLLDALEAYRKGGAR